MPPDRRFLQRLATSFLAGGLSVEGITQRATAVLGRPYRWVRPLATRFMKAVSGKARPRRREVVLWLKHDRGLSRAWEKNGALWSVGGPLVTPLPISLPDALNWNLPTIESIGELANWLDLDAGELEWLADTCGFDYRREECGPLSNYHYRLLTKKSGSVRLIEMPKSRLKEAQRKILAKILDRVPSHRLVHGFVKGRSIKTFVAPHVGREAVLRMDMSNFFPSF